MRRIRRIGYLSVLGSLYLLVAAVCTLWLLMLADVLTGCVTGS